MPAPDYPLWTAVGEPVGRHAGPLPLRRGRRLAARPRRHRARRSRRARARSSSSTRTTRPARSIRTSCCVEIVELARQHRLIVFADEIYDKTLYDGAHAHVDRVARRRRAVRSPSTACRRTTARAAIAPAGWSSRARSATPRDYIDGLSMLASMRLCSNVPGQFAIQTALGGYQSIDDLVAARRPARAPARSRARAAHGDSRASPASSRRRRSTCSRSSTRRSTRSTTTSSSSSSCSPSRRC